MSNFAKMMEELCQPFPPADISWLPGASKDNKCMALAYADLRVYQNRLDEVCGLDWSCKYLPWGDSRIVCELTIAGTTRSSTGEMGNQDEKNEIGGTVAEAQAFKRACAQFGLGRYLYSLPSPWIDYDAQRKRITDGGLAELNRRYRAWFDRTMAARHPVAASNGHELAEAHA